MAQAQCAMCSGSPLLAQGREKDANMTAEEEASAMAMLEDEEDRGCAPREQRSKAGHGRV